MGELSPSTLVYKAPQLGIGMVAEVQEGRRGSPLLTLKEHGDERGCQHQRGSGLDAVERGQRADAFAGGPFASEASFTMPAAALVVRPADTRGFELELHAGPANSWEIQTSTDLKTWQGCSPTPMTMRAGTNGVQRLNIDASAERQFFRARSID